MMHGEGRSKLLVNYKRKYFLGLILHNVTLNIALKPIVNTLHRYFISVAYDFVKQFVHHVFYVLL